MRDPKSAPTRRDFLKNSGQVAAAASAFTGLSVPSVYAGQDSTIQFALVGCGGRGTGAAGDALSVENQGPLKLVAMADVFADRLEGSLEAIKDDESIAKKIDVADDRKFVGFDAYKKAMDCLKPGDVVILTTPPAFRPLMFEYAISKGLNVFMEKPVIVDGPSARKILALNEDAEKKNLKVGIGLMCRHCKARQELHDRIRDGEIGEIQMLRAYRQVSTGGLIDPKPEGINDLLYQIKNFHGFLWASGGVFMDYMIHNIDESCWMKDAWPVTAQGSGARCYRGDKIDQNFDNYAIEYTFGDGTKMFVYTRHIPGCHNEFASYAHGTRGSAVISTAAHTPAKSRMYRGQDLTKKDDMFWRYAPKEPNPYRVEWQDMIAAIRNDQPYNEVKRGVAASIVTAMGRSAVHTGQIISYDDILNSDHDFAPGLAELNLESAAPLVPGPDGKYPVPQPGLLGKREF